MQQHSPTYLNILDLLFKLQSQTVNGNSYSTTIENGTFKRTALGANSSKIPQEILIADLEFGKQCTPHEKYFIIWEIGNELKMYNALWYCKPELKKSSTNRLAIKGLIEKGIISKTETTNIYFVNPYIVRRGELFAVLTTTAHILENEGKVSVEHIRDKRALKDYNYGKHTKLIGNGDEGYMYSPDIPSDN